MVTGLAGDSKLKEMPAPVSVIRPADLSARAGGNIINAIAFGLAGMGQKSDNLGDEYLIPAYGLFDAGLFATATKTLGAWTLSGGVRADVSEVLRTFRGLQPPFSGHQRQPG